MFFSADFMYLCASRSTIAMLSFGLCREFMLIMVSFLAMFFLGGLSLISFSLWCGDLTVVACLCVIATFIFLISINEFVVVAYYLFSFFLASVLSRAYSKY